jgi:DNA-binding NtrC family response regulator
MTRVLIVEDKKSLNEFLCEALSAEGYQLISCSNGIQGLEAIRNEAPEIMITDMKMPGLTGMELLKEVSGMANPPLVIIMTAFATVDSAVAAMKMGAFDYITKPVGIDRLVITLEKACRNLELLNENKNLKRELKKRYRYDNIIGSCENMKEVFEIVDRVVESRCTVMLYGESGTGKDLIAKAIHYSSSLAGKRFVKVNCATLTGDLLNSRLFGHVKGSFTGAIQNRQGLFEIADGGTLFLDEIGELCLDTQARLLRVLQEKSFSRVGDDYKEIKVDVRIIAATNKDLNEDMRQGRFREDLFYRLNVVPVTLPPLRERKSDIPTLVNYFIDKISRETGVQAVPFSDEAVEILKKARWTGNVRELENVVERALVLCRGNIITPADLPEYIRGKQKDLEGMDVSACKNLNQAVEILEKNMILRALENNDWIQTKTADELGINRGALIYKIKKYGLEKNNDEKMS